MWPHHAKPFHDLPAQLWILGDNDDKLECVLPETAQLMFAGYQNALAVPLYQIWGPELEVTPNDPVSRQFFAEFIQVPSAAIQLKISNLETDLGFDSILLFPTGTDFDTRVRARLLRSGLSVNTLPISNHKGAVLPDLCIEHYAKHSESLAAVPSTNTDSEPKPYQGPLSRRINLLVSTNDAGLVPTTDFPDPFKPLPTKNSAEISNSLASVTPRRPFDVKKTIQHTIMAGLRLRGIRSAHKNFKRLYFSILNLVEVATEQMDPPNVTTTFIHNTVEAILVAIEPRNSI